MDEHPPTFTEHWNLKDGVHWVTVDYWPNRILVTEDFLECAYPTHVERDGDRFRITVANGEATYRIVSRRTDFPTVVFERTDSPTIVFECEAVQRIWRNIEPPEAEDGSSMFGTWR